MPTREKKIVELYLAGIPVKDISRLLNVSISTIYNVLKRYNVELRRGQKKRLTGNEITIAVRLYEEGMSIYRIAKILGRDPSTIYRLIKKMNSGRG